jgi:hypothetical protein
MREWQNCSATAIMETASLRRTHDVAGIADDAVLLAEQVERLDSLFSEAADSARRKHASAHARLMVSYSWTRRWCAG